MVKIAAVLFLNVTYKRIAYSLMLLYDVSAGGAVTFLFRNHVFPAFILARNFCETYRKEKVKSDINAA